MPNKLFQRSRERVNSYDLRRSIKCCLLSLSIFLLTISVAYAQVVPALSTVSPQGAQQGQNIEVTLTGKNLDIATADLVQWQRYHRRN